MAPLVVMSVALLLICIQFGTEWIGFSQIIDIIWQVLHEGTFESDRIGQPRGSSSRCELPRVLLGFLWAGAWRPSVSCCRRCCGTL